MTRNVELTAVLLPAPEDGFTAVNPETGVTTQGLNGGADREDGVEPRKRDGESTEPSARAS